MQTYSKDYVVPSDKLYAPCRAKYTNSYPYLLLKVSDNKGLGGVGKLGWWYGKLYPNPDWKVLWEPNKCKRHE